jgi:hypothetical protein
MSKASDFAKNKSAVMEFTIKDNEDPITYVDRDGELVIESNILSPTKALELSDWIKDKFRENTGTNPLDEVVGALKHIINASNSLTISYYAKHALERIEGMKENG